MNIIPKIEYKYITFLVSRVDHTLNITSFNSVLIMIFESDSTFIDVKQV